jgi:hypothetical protein
MDAGAIYVWSAYNLKNNAPHDIASFNTAGSFPADVSVDTLGNGIVVGVARTANINNQTISFTGISNDSQTGTQPFIHTGGHAGFVPAATPRTVTAIRSTGLAPVACALSWR